MKKSLLILTAALTFGGFAQAQLAPSAAQVPALTDVPAGHWAKDAIDRLVSRGIILGYPDGTFRGTHNLTRYEASIIIARLLDQINSGVVVAPQGDDLSALQNAVQELSADLAALGVRVSDIEANAVSKDDFARLEARIDALGAANGNPEALADLEARISGLGGGDYDALRGDVDDLASSITALNDLTVLLNQDILDLQDRVSNLESTQDFVKGSDFVTLDGRVVALDGRISNDLNTLSTRVTKLENGPKFSVTGGIDAGYGYLILTKGTKEFDVSRLTNKTFAYNLLGDKKVRSADAESGYEGNVEFGIKASNIMTANGKVVINNAELSFGIDDAFTAGKKTYLSLASAGVDGLVDGQKFNVKYSADFSDFKFNDYLFNNPEANKSILRRGVVAEIEGSKLFLTPNLTVVAGNALPDPKNDAHLNVPAEFKGNYFGIRASVNPFSYGTVGLAYANNDDNRSAVGVDFDLGFGPKYAVPVKGKDGKPVLDDKGNPKVDLKSPFTVVGLANFSIRQDSPNYNFQNALNSSDNAYKVDARANFGIAKLGAQYLRVDPAYAYSNKDILTKYPHQNAGMSAKNDLPADVNSYQVAAAANVDPVAVDGYYTSKASISAPEKGTQNAFGVAAGLKFRALKVAGFYNNTKHDGKKDASGNVISEVIDYAGKTHAGTDVLKVAKVPYVATSTAGGVLSHDGSAPDAFVKGLNFTVADAYFYDKKINDLQVYGSYTAKFADITLQPFARYHMLTAPQDNAVKINSYNTIKYGVEATTEPFVNIPLQPSVYAKYAGRTTTNQNNATNGSNVANETLVQAGLTLNRVLTDGLKASVGYAYYKGNNVGAIITGADEGAYKGTADHIYSTPVSDKPFEGGNIGKETGSINGIYAQADWNGWTANYGVFNYFNGNDKDATSVAQGFKVGYNFKF